MVRKFFKIQSATSLLRCSRGEADVPFLGRALIIIFGVAIVAIGSHPISRQYGSLSNFVHKEGSRLLAKANIKGFSWDNLSKERLARLKETEKLRDNAAPPQLSFASLLNIFKPDSSATRERELEQEMLAKESGSQNSGRAKLSWSFLDFNGLGLQAPGKNQATKATDVVAPEAASEVVEEDIPLTPPPASKSKTAAPAKQYDQISNKDRDKLDNFISRLP